MAQELTTPGGLFSDEEAAVSPVLQSTVAECGLGLQRALLPDLSAISTGQEQDLMRVIEATQQLLLKERQEKFELEICLCDEIYNKIMEYLDQRQQRGRDQKEMYEDKLNNLMERLMEEIEEMENQDEKIKEVEAALQEAKQPNAKEGEWQETEESLCRSKEIASFRQVLLETQKRLETEEMLGKRQAELSATTQELRKLQKMMQLPPSARPIAADIDREIKEGQKNVRLLRSKILNLGEMFQSDERACCHSTNAGKLRESLNKCGNMLVKQDQIFAKLQDNMILLKMDMRKKAVKKRFCVNNENAQPGSQPPTKKPFGKKH